MAITTQDIHRAADEIAESGGSPTLAAVRKALGGGSFTTISEAMQEWKSSRAAPAPIREPAPEAISARLGEIAGEMWATALEMANTRLQAERDALERVRQETEQARREAEEVADQLSKELDQAKNALAEAMAETVRLTSELTNAQRRADTAKAALDESRRQNDQWADLLKIQVRGEAEKREQTVPQDYESAKQKPKAKKPKPKNMDIEDA